MYSFYAFLSRMKYINRWGLMKNLQPENIAEHSQQTALIAHALAVIENKVYGKSLNADKIGMMAVFHETGEVITGDMPTPIKYFSLDIVNAYKNVEAKAEDKLLNMLPDVLKEDVAPLVKPCKDSYEYKIVKAADKLAAFIKCIEELRSFNNEFKSAHKSTKEIIDKLCLEIKSVSFFMDNFIDSYYKNLDELI